MLTGSGINQPVRRVEAGAVGGPAAGTAAE